MGPILFKLCYEEHSGYIRLDPFFVSVLDSVKISSDYLTTNYVRSSILS